MAVTEQLRRAIHESGKTHYRIWKDSDVDSRAIDRFVAGETDLKGATIDSLCDYFGLELRPKKTGTTVKQAAKKTATKRKRRKKSAE